MTPEMRDLHDTVVVVTGAGSGIGAATVQLLLECGARVVAGELHPERLNGICNEYPGRVVAVAADVREPSAASALIAAGLDTWGRVDSVVANAGVGFFGGTLDTTVEQIHTMVQTNFLGTVWLAREALRHFREQGTGGDIVVLSSVAGLGSGGGSEAVYAATKAAQIQFATSLDREVRTEGVRLSVVAPAAVNTGFAVATGRFGDKPFEEGDFIRPADIAFGVVTTLRQPRRMRTALWTMWSLAEVNG